MRRVSTVEWPIEELELTARSHNGLKREGVDDIGQLAAMTEKDLMNLHNLGAMDVEEIRSKLREHGYELGYDA